jgi:cobalt-zinc-cadmium efflux system membrane fusion protein
MASSAGRVPPRQASDNRRKVLHAESTYEVAVRIPVTLNPMASAPGVGKSFDYDASACAGCSAVSLGPGLSAQRPYARTPAACAQNLLYRWVALLKLMREHLQRCRAHRRAQGAPLVNRAVIAVLLLVAACRKHEERKDPRPPPGEAWLSPQQMKDGQVEVAPVEEQPVASELQAPGRITFDDSSVAHVFSPVSGRVVRIEAALGERVRKGAPLATLQSPDVGGAAADLGKAEADLRAAKRDLRRQRELVEAQAGAQKDLDAAQSARDRAVAELARARQRARMFGRGGDRVSQEVTLRAPIDGEVVARSVSPGVEIAGQSAGGSSPELFTIGNIETVWATADVFEMDLARVKPGAPVSVGVVAYPGKVFQGRVDWISSVLDPVSRSARVRATLRNDGRELLPEMYATLAISTSPRKALTIPRSALLHLGDERVVLVEIGHTENGLLRFQQRRVRIDADDADPVVVTSGLERGEVVVSSGTILVSGML